MTDTRGPQGTFDEVADVLRCTAFITDRDIRARYVVTDLRLRGFIVQRVVRDAAGRFQRAVR